jgi:hypothetical protein
VQFIYHPELSVKNQKPLKNQEPKITAYVKEVLQKINDKQLTQELFIPGAGDGILPYAEQAAALFSSFGVLDNIELIFRKPSDNGDVLYQYRLTYGDKQMLFLLGLTKNNKIYSIDLVR